jgi:hypothetical protein
VIVDVKEDHPGKGREILLREHLPVGPGRPVEVAGGPRSAHGIEEAVAVGVVEHSLNHLCSRRFRVALPPEPAHERVQAGGDHARLRHHPVDSLRDLVQPEPPSFEESQGVTGRFPE